MCGLECVSYNPKINDKILYGNKELDNVAKVVIEQLNAVVETLATIKAESTKVPEQIEAPKPIAEAKPAKEEEEEAKTADMVKNPQPRLTPFTEPECVKEPESVREVGWVQVTAKKAKKNKKKSKGPGSPAPKEGEAEVNRVDTPVEAVKVSELIEVAATEQPKTVCDTKPDVVEIVEQDRAVLSNAVEQPQPVSCPLPHK